MAQDRFKYFRIEAREILDGLARGLLDLERQADPAVIARLLRLAHTLKGAARIVGHRELAELAHQIEGVLAPLRDAPAAGRHDAALALIDRMAAHVAAMQAPEPAAPDAQRLARSADPTPPPPPPRVDPGAIDDVLAGLAEIHTLVRRLRGVDDLAALGARIDQLERELRGVRQDAERLRLVAAGTSFTQLERTARDAAHASGKQVAFASSGGEVRVDAHVLATLHGALVQLVRNAVAHGIEPPDERVAAGKRAEGQVTVAVALHGSRIAVTCRDDGRGVDLEAVRRAVIARGVAADRARGLDRDQLIALLLRGGLTTSVEVTSLAGRGIGLDVVRDAAHGLGGEVTVRTGAGGTEITIAAPTSVAAVPALVLEGGDRIAAVPLAAIRRVARSAAMAILRGPDGLSVALDDVTVPLALLGRLLGAPGGAARAIVIVDGGDGLAALGADRVLGVDEIVVRALPAGAPVDPIVWGVALDAEGVPRPVLEPAALVAAIRALPPLPEPPVMRPPPILVVDDSLTTRMLEQSILESAGYEVELASSAEDGLARLATRACGLVLVDVEMPGMDGFAFIAALRAQPQLAQIPAILVTSRNRPEDRQRGTAVGAQGYVVKGDFDQSDLLDLIRRLVRR
ncbi:MAG TPA: response regulator [Kofleriaceae bacterium]|jgi:two-component system chemotaxis sensor kinase CheA